MRRLRGFGKRSLMLVCALALGVSFVAIGSNANAFDEPIPSNVGIMKPANLFKLVSKPAAAPLSDCVAGNPIDLGGLVTATMGTGTLTCTLPAAGWEGKDTGGWKVLGKCEPGKLKGYKYLNKSASDPGNPCKVILVKSNVIKIIAKGSGALPNPLASGNPPTNISLEVGNDSYCAEWTSYATEKADKLVKVKKGAAPSSCATSTTTTTTTTLAPTTTTTTQPPTPTPIVNPSFELGASGAPAR